MHSADPSALRIRLSCRHRRHLPPKAGLIRRPPGVAARIAPVEAALSAVSGCRPGPFRRACVSALQHCVR